MRKSILFSLALLAILSFSIVPAMAGKSCGSVEAKLGQADAAKFCSAHEINAKTASYDCDFKEKCETITISVKGMTCGGCENGLTTALEGTDGVIKVQKVSYKENLAVVCIDPTKTKSESLTKLIASKGYEVAIIPAVATTGVNAVQAGSSTMSKEECAKKMSKEECAKFAGAKSGACCASKDKAKTTTDGSL